MTKIDKKNQKIRRNQNNIKFQDFVTWLEDNGFSLDRINGSHHIFIHPVIETPINAQKRKMGQLKHIKLSKPLISLMENNHGIYS